MANGVIPASQRGTRNLAVSTMRHVPVAAMSVTLKPNRYEGRGRCVAMTAIDTALTASIAHQAMARGCSQACHHSLRCRIKWKAPAHQTKPTSALSQSAYSEWLLTGA